MPLPEGIEICTRTWQASLLWVNSLLVFGTLFIDCLYNGTSCDAINMIETENADMDLRRNGKASSVSPYQVPFSPKQACMRATSRSMHMNSVQPRQILHMDSLYTHSSRDSSLVTRCDTTTHSSIISLEEDLRRTGAGSNPSAGHFFFIFSAHLETFRVSL